MDHIILVNRSYFPKIDDLKQGKNKLPFLAKFGFIVTFFGNSIKGYAQPDRKKRTKTFRIWDADKSNFSKNILDDFQRHQAELKRYIEDSGNLIKGKAIISSPANKYFVYTLAAAFDIIVVHEERHYNQAMGLLEGMLRASATAHVDKC
ncbi:MAG TPA: DinB family protein [Cytophagales bacterium]|nr:DinB family protein [Cytophagales bacterium]